MIEIMSNETLGKIITVIVFIGYAIFYTTITRKK